MRDVHRECEGPLAGWVDPFASWLVFSGCAPGRARRAVLAFGRLSSWLAARAVGLTDLDEDVIDEYMLAEQLRSGSKFPSAFQYLPLAKRFLASQGLVTLRGPATRDRGGYPDCWPVPLARWSRIWWRGCAPRATPLARRRRSHAPRRALVCGWPRHGWASRTWTTRCWTGSWPRRCAVQHGIRRRFAGSSRCASS